MVTIRRRAASIYDLKCHEGFAKLAGGFPLPIPDALAADLAADDVKTVVVECFTFGRDGTGG